MNKLGKIITVVAIIGIVGYAATSFAVLTAAMLAFASGADGQGALSLWPLFGAVNQTLAALALILVTLYLKRKSRMKWLISGIPALFMSVMTLWASVLNQFQFGVENNLLLQIINAAIVLIVLWIIIEGVIKFFRTNSVDEIEISEIKSS